jgi:NDP-sugar pyrophosphorylase family protein/thiamine kinase-like enzyme
MFMPFKVLVTTSGVGSRLGEFTKFTNKSLLRIGNKPAISYIIESYPQNTEFVITLGYFGEQVKNFLLIAYPERKFEFVWVEKYEGEMSSLLFSLSHAKDLLQAPFIFHASDTIILDNIPAPNYNWNAGYKGKGSSSYASFDVMGSRVSVMYEKGNLNPDFLHVGLVGIFDFELFWNLVDKILIEENYGFTLGDVDVLKRMVPLSEFGVFECKQWHDIGNVDKMNEAKSQLDHGDIHVLDKLGESIFKVNGRIIKFFYDEVICNNRISRNSYLKGIVPEITIIAKNFYSYDYVKGDLYANVANNSNFPEFLNWAKVNLWKETNSVSKEKLKELCLDFYFNKTEKRLSDFYRSRGVEDKVEVINGEEIPKISTMLNQINKDELCDSIPTLFHGDFILDNVLKVDKENYILIDWRQDFAGELVAGDKYYDLGKLAHNLVVNHEIIDNNHFYVKKGKEDSISINIYRFQSLVDCEQKLFEWLQSNGYDVRKVKILRAIIWLNMSPLHHHPFDLFLYYFGKYNLYQALKNE